MAPIETRSEIVDQGKPNIHDEGPTYLRMIKSPLITCMVGDFVVYVSIVHVRVPLSNVDEGTVRDL